MLCLAMTALNQAPPAALPDILTVKSKGIQVMLDSDFKSRTSSVPPWSQRTQK